MSAKKELSKIYVLKKADTEVLSFRFQTDFWQTSVLIDDVYRPEMLTFYIQNRGITPESLFKWIRRRLIPEHRIYAGRLLEKLHTDIRDIEEILKISYGLSLNDDYWIVPESQNVSFNKYNLFDNPFSEVIATLAISGNGPQLEHKFYPSPEFTTGGMLPKCWKRTGSTEHLWKAGVTEISKLTMEPYSEYLASQLAEAMGIPYVPYQLEEIDNKLFSVCKIFTSKEISFVPMAQVSNGKNIRDVVDTLKQLEEKYSVDLMNHFVDMLIFDGVILNVDRHMNNFGLLFDNHSNTPVGFAPLFDHGNSLLHSVPTKDLNQIKSRAVRYIHPVMYKNFHDPGKLFASDRVQELLSRVKDFKLREHPEIQFPSDRLAVLNDIVRTNILEMLGEEKDFSMSNIYEGKEL